MQLNLTLALQELLLNKLVYLIYRRRIYPPEDKTLLEKYENLLAVAFQTFLSGRAASFQRELNNPLKRMKVKE